METSPNDMTKLEQRCFSELLNALFQKAVAEDINAFSSLSIPSDTAE